MPFSDNVTSTGIISISQGTGKFPGSCPVTVSQYKAAAGQAVSFLVGQGELTCLKPPPSAGRVGSQDAYILS